MKKIMDKIGIETLWGGIFGVVAVVAAILELVLGGVNGAAVAGAVKDISGTLVTVMILVVAIRGLQPHRNIIEKIEQALSDWQQTNSALIIKSTDDNKTEKYGFHMRTDITNFYGDKPLTKNAGWFVRLPALVKENYISGNIQIEFHLNKGTFFEGAFLSQDELKTQFDILNQRFCAFVNAQYKDFLTAGGKNDTIVVTIQNPIRNDQDVQKLIDMLNSMLQAYLVSAKGKGI